MRHSLGTGNAKLGHGETGADLSLDEGLEPALLLLGVTVAGENLCVLVGNDGERESETILVRRGGERKVRKSAKNALGMRE